MFRLSDSFKGTGARYDKVRSPEETLAWVMARLDSFEVPLLEHTERIDRDRLGIPVYVSRYTPEAARLTGTYKQMGKGITPAQAETSAVMELVERFSVFWFRDHFDFTRCSAGDFETRAMPLEHMVRVFAGHEFNSGIMDIFPSLPIEWCSGIFPLNFTGMMLPFSWFWPINEYNGSAAGNSLEEAAVQAVSEVVERHVCSVITRQMLRTPEIDPDSLTDPAARALLDKFAQLGIRVVLKDFSLDTGISTVAAVAWDPSTFPHRSEIVYTAGTSPDPQRAVIRTLTEVAQLAGDFDTSGRYLESGLPKFQSLEQMSYVLDSSGTVPVDALPCCASPNFLHELKMMCQALEDALLPVYLVDITHPVLEVPAVYAVIPGNQFRDRTADLEPVFHCARVAASSFEYDPHRAFMALSMIQEAYPQRYESAFFLGHAFEMAGEFRDAVEWYRKALELGAGDEEASIRCHLGLCFRETGDIEGAVKELLAAREINPELKEIHNQLGFCYYTSGDYYSAIECFEAAIDIDPGSAIDYANIGSNLRKLGMYGPALKWYGMALELDPELEWAAGHMEEIRSCDAGGKT